MSSRPTASLKRLLGHRVSRLVKPRRLKAKHMRRLLAEQLESRRVLTNDPFYSFDLAANAKPDAPADASLVANFVAESAADGTAVGITAASSDPEGATLRYRLTDDAGGRFAIGELSGIVTVANSSLINYESTQNHYISIVANDGFIDSDPTVFAIAVGNVRPTKPTDSDLASNFVWENVSSGDPVGIRAASSDPNGAPFRYRLTNDAGGRFAIDPVTGVITVANASLINYETARTHSVVVVVTDGYIDSDPTTFSVSVANISPSSLSDSDAAQNFVKEDATNGTPVGIIVVATDPNGAPLQYILTNNAGGRFTINSTTGVVTVFNTSLINYESAQSHSITVVANDGTATSSAVSFLIAVGNVESSIPVDNDPVVNEVYEGASNGTYTGLTVQSTDPKGPAVTYRLISDAEGLFAIDAASGAVTVANGSMLSYQSASSHSIVVEAKDPAGLVAVQTFTIAVRPVNTPPRLQPIADQRVDEQDVLEFNATASDDDVPEQGLRYSLDAASTALGMTINPATGLFSWTPTETQGGEVYPVTITVTDNGGNPDQLSDSQTITITVAEVNVAPELAAIDDQQVDEQAELSFTVSATDQDAPVQTLRYSLDESSIAQGMAIDAETGLFTWAPSEAQGGAVYSVTILATDDGSDPDRLADSQAFTIAVDEVNVAPQLALVGNKQVDEQANLTFTVSAADQDLPVQTLRYSLDDASLALGMRIDSETGVFSWTPSEAQGGAIYAVVVAVTDDGDNPDSLEDQQSFEITVEEVNAAPVLNAITDQTVDEQSLLSFTASAFDQDAPVQTLTYSLDLTSLSLGMSIDPLTGVFKWIPTETQGGGLYSVTLTVTDSGTNPSELYDSQTFVIDVKEANVAPELAPIADMTVNEQITLTFTASATDQDVPLQRLAFSLDADSLSRGMTIDPVTGVFRWTPTESQGGAVYPVTVRVSDDGTNPAKLEHSQTFAIAVVDMAGSVVIVDDTELRGERILQIFGTTGADTIHIKHTNDPNTIRVELNDVPYSVVIDDPLIPPVTRIVVYGDSENDNIHVWKQLDMPTELHGGAGDDQLRGGAASDMLLGGDGNDDLFGNDGRDLLIGGAGADDIRGGDDDDILIGGWTSLDSSIVALDAVLREWRSNRNFGERVDNLRGVGSGSRLNQEYLLIDEGATETVWNDGAVDSLRGDSGRDWFFADLPQDISVEALILDTIKNLSAAERRRLSTVFAQALKAIGRA